MGMKSSVIKALSRAAPPLLWRDDQPGNPFIHGDEVFAEHNSIVMVRVERYYLSGYKYDNVDVYLPDITPESAGMQVHIRNQITMSQKGQPGRVRLIAGDNDNIESLSPIDVPLLFPEFPWIEYAVLDPGTGAVQVQMGQHFSLESDGDSRWSFIFPMSGIQFLSTGA